MENNSFNAKYKISQELSDKFVFSDAGSRSNSNIAGKPKKMILEIIKRFFKNPYVTISFLAFIALLLCSIIFPAISKFSPNSEVAKDNVNMLQYLPPSYAPMKTLVLNPSDEPLTTYNKILKLIEKYPTYKPYFAGLLDTASKTFDGYTGQYSFTFNAYKMYDASVLLTKINLEHANNGNQVISDAKLTELSNSVPSFSLLLGSDSYGRDIWTTSWYATSESIKIALITAITQTIIGVSIGAFLGFKVGTKIDTIAMRVIEIFLAPPSLIWMLLFVSIFGISNTALILSLVITGWAWPVSSTRMFIITVKDEEYITAAKSIGAKTGRQVFYHALPAILGKIATSFVRTIPSIILSIASLAFLGFYRDANSVNLGQLLLESSQQAASNVWILLLPSLILLTLSLTLQFVALGVHDALDPKVISKKH
ncbi:ABC transporter permease [[Mycoplasma] gypis]|uniref:ABC transporter permease n=1 Tax=[Mycoplasma] gypis TaxID=92404 RepID=A0ABZ2RM68_9BACT|nr:ABC transporter permease [[Mycoplasma] gypis]MBN0919232.1 ABC transporter permease [[Mycoplasma] gypis]